MLVLLGVGILGHFDWRTLRFGRGEWETLLCSAFFVGQILWIERPEFAGNRPGVVTLLMFAIQAAGFTLLAAVTAPSARALVVTWASPAWIGMTLILAVVCTIGAFSIMNRWQPKITSTEAGLIYCIEPVIATVVASFLPGWISRFAGITYTNETLTWSLLVGGVLIVGATVLVASERRMAFPPSGRGRPVTLCHHLPRSTTRCNPDLS